jgi:hypothetical protein
MPNQELLTYIETALSAGQTKEQIINTLLKGGWPEEIIYKVFSDIENTLTPIITTTSIPNENSSTPLIHTEEKYKKNPFRPKRLVIIILGTLFTGLVLLVGTAYVTNYLQLQALEKSNDEAWQKLQKTANGLGFINSPPVQDFSKQEAKEPVTDTSNGVQTLPQSDEELYQDVGNPLALVTVTGTAKGSAVDVQFVDGSYTGKTVYADVYKARIKSAGPLGVTDGKYGGTLKIGKGNYKILIYDHASGELLETRQLSLTISPLWGPPTITIDKDSLSPTSTMITGTATNVNQLSIIYDHDLYDAEVIDGKWTIKKKLTSGTHTITVKTYTKSENVQATETYDIQ